MKVNHFKDPPECDKIIKCISLVYLKKQLNWTQHWKWSSFTHSYFDTNSFSWSFVIFIMENISGKWFGILQFLTATVWRLSDQIIENIGWKCQRKWHIWNMTNLKKYGYQMILHKTSFLHLKKPFTPKNGNSIIFDSLLCSSKLVFMVFSHGLTALVISIYGKQWPVNSSSIPDEQKKVSHTDLEKQEGE